MITFVMAYIIYLKLTLSEGPLDLLRPLSYPVHDLESIRADIHQSITGLYNNIVVRP